MSLPLRALSCAAAVLMSIGAAFGQSSTLLFHGGRIVVNDGKGTTAEALLARDGRVVAVGPLSELRARPDASGATRIDLHGATAVPGLQDAHAQLEAYARSLVDLDLAGCTSYADLISRVKARAATLPEGTWIRGRGWDHDAWIDPEPPHHFLLSTAVPNHPVYLVRADGQAALVNLAALTLVGLDGPLEPPPRVVGGRVLVDETHRASGLLVNTAMELVEHVIPAEDPATRLKRFLTAQDDLLARGLTCVHDMGTSRATLELLQTLRAKGELRLRVVAYVDGSADGKQDPLAGLPLAPDPLDLLSVPGVRLVLDGSVGTRAAALIDDYADAARERGTLLFSEDELASRVARIARAGLQPVVHAVGDRANRAVLDVFERMRIAVDDFAARRPRVEHALVVLPKDWARYPDLGIVTSMVPLEATIDRPWVVARLGEERARGLAGWRALVPDLGRLAFGGDFPVERPDPLGSLYAARTRLHPGSNVHGPLEEGATLDGGRALAAFTSGAAYAAFQDDRRGRLLPGFACDVTVVSVDPTTCPADDLRRAKVLMTVVNGQIAWRAR